MNKGVTFLVLMIFFIFNINFANAQEPRLATFQETAQVLFDQQLSKNVTSAITLQTSSNTEIKIPTDLVKKIHDIERVIAVIITNEDQCVLGVMKDDACVMINFSGEDIEGGIIGIQDKGKEIGNSLISDINEALDINSELHSVYVHHRDQTNVALETSGIISGKGTVSAVYTMPKENTYSMYQKLTGILLPKVIRDSGGFIDVANNLSTDDNSRMTISIIPQDNLTLFQIKLSLNYPNKANAISDVSPLEFLKVDKLERSDYFSQNFYPLNSLLKVVILSEESIGVSKVNTNLVPIVIKDEERLPQFENDGWFFEQESGNKIDGTYLFGKKSSVNKNELIFTVAPLEGLEPIENRTISTPADFDSFEIVILVGIIMVAVGAVVFYLKGFKAKS